MAPERSKSAKPGGLRLPGTFTSPSPNPSPSPSSSSSVPRRAATARASTSRPSSTTPRKLPGNTASVPASRLAARSNTRAAGNEGGLISSFGVGAGNGGSGRLDRAKSSPGGVQGNDTGQSRLERLGLNRASMKEPSRRSPSPEASESEEEDRSRRSQTPKSSWGRGSSDEEEARPVQPTTRRRRDSFSPVRTSSPSLRHSRSPRPESIAASSVAASSIIPPVRNEKEEEEHKPAEEAKGTLFGSLWNKAATAWNGGPTAESTPVKEISTEAHQVQNQLKEDPFRKTKRVAEENEEAKSSSTEKKPTSSTTEQSRAQHSPQQQKEYVEPITYHRPPETHPRNILPASAHSRFRHDDAYDWLGDEPKSPLDAYLFHRRAGRMATKKVRLKRPPPQGMATAPAILSGAALGYGNSGLTGNNPGVFVSKESMGPVQGFSQPARLPPIAAPHPGLPPIPPPMPPGFRPPGTTSSSSASANPLATNVGGSASAAPAVSIAPGFPIPLSQSSISQPSNPSAPPNPNALPAFPAPTQPAPNGSGALATQSQPQSQAQAQPRPAVAPLPQYPPAPSALPARMPGSYITSSAPLPVPAPVFTAPVTGPPTSINTEGPVGDMFKTALAKKLFGSQLSDAPPKPTAPNTFAGVPVGSFPLGYGGIPLMQYPFVVAPQLPIGGQAQQPQTSSEPRLPTPAAPTENGASQEGVSSSPSVEGTASPTAADHGVLPPMPIPQSITPPPPAKSSISFAPARPMSGLGGWILPAPTLTPFRSPSPSSSARSISPAPTSRDGTDTPATSVTPVPSHVEVNVRSPRDETVDGHDAQKSAEEGKEGEHSNSATPRLSGTPTPDSGNENEPIIPLLSVPNFAALATPLPPSPAPSTFVSITPSASPAPRQVSPAPTLPVISSSTTTDHDGTLPLYSTSKKLPPSPSPSPALPPLPMNDDFSSILSPSLPSKSPALPPLPPSSPTPVIPPRPFSAASTNALPFISSSSPSVTLQRAPSLAISTDSAPSPQAQASPGLDVASITLQPPTPIEPNEPPAGPRDVDNNEGGPAQAVLAPLVPLSLDLDLGSSSLSFSFDSLDFSTPSIVPDLPDTQSYFSSLGLNFGGGDRSEGDTATIGEVDRDDEGRLELPVLREENLLESDEIELEYEDDDMSDQFDAATSFVSGFRETDLARAKVDPGHTGRTEKWLEGQGMRNSPDFESLKRGTNNEDASTANVPEGASTTIFRPRTAPPSSIPPSSLPPSYPTITPSLRPTVPTVSKRYLSLNANTLSTLSEDDDNQPSPVQTMINFDKPLSSLNRGREISSTFGGSSKASEKAKEVEEEKRRKALGALSNSAFEEPSLL